MKRIRRVIFVLGITFMMSLLHISLSAVHSTDGDVSLVTGNQTHITPDIMRRFRGFKTNLRKHSINLNLVRDGGPDKDGIPITLTWKRWEDHILIGHPAMAKHLEAIRLTISDPDYILQSESLA